MKRLRIWGEAGLFLGVLIMALAVALLSKAELGVTIVVTPAYLLSLRFDWLTFGMADYAVQFMLLCVLAIVTRRLTIKYALAFVTSVMYGASLDLMMYLLRSFQPTALFERILCFTAALLLSAVSVALFYRTNLPLMAYDMFIKELAAHVGWAVGKVKIVNDIGMLVFSLALSFALLGGIRGISVGTFVSAGVMGPLIIGVGKALDRVVDLTPRFDIKFDAPPNNG